MNTNEGRFQKGDLETNVGRGVKNKQQGAVMTSLPKFDYLCMDGGVCKYKDSYGTFSIFLLCLNTKAGFVNLRLGFYAQ